MKAELLICFDTENRIEKKIVTKLVNKNCFYICDKEHKQNVHCEKLSTKICLNLRQNINLDHW